jgi:cytochrome c553
MKKALALFAILALLAGCSSETSDSTGKLTGIAAGAGTSPNGGTLDTSFAVEYSYSCLSGGCHETNQQLVDQHSQSLMTHTMVKCNACHGTHTAAEVGQPKPNLTGYHAGMGATGYIVGKDRCLVCHTAIEANNRHPKRPSECISCHAPHIFPVNK